MVRVHLVILTPEPKGRYISQKALLAIELTALSYQHAHEVNRWVESALML